MRVVLTLQTAAHAGRTPLAAGAGLRDVQASVSFARADICTWPCVCAPHRHLAANGLQCTHVDDATRAHNKHCGRQGRATERAAPAVTPISCRRTVASAASQRAGTIHTHTHTRGCASDPASLPALTRSSTRTATNSRHWPPHTSMHRSWLLCMCGGGCCRRDRSGNAHPSLEQACPAARTPLAAEPLERQPSKQCDACESAAYAVCVCGRHARCAQACLTRPPALELAKACSSQLLQGHPRPCMVCGNTHQCVWCAPSTLPCTRAVRQSPGRAVHSSAPPNALEDPGAWDKTRTLQKPRATHMQLAQHHGASHTAPPAVKTGSMKELHDAHRRLGKCPCAPALH